MVKIKFSALDKIINWVSPVRANARAIARIRNQVLTEHFGTRKYEGASRGRRTDKWLTQNYDANSEIIPAADLLRSRSRDLIRNNPWASKGVKEIQNSVIGRGIVVEFDAPKVRQTQQINAAWKQWAETKACDWVGLCDFNGLQKLTLRCVVESGETLVRLHYLEKNNGAVPFQLELLEPDFLDRTKISEPTTGNRVLNGIEIDSQGRKVAYHFYKQHPGSKNFFGFGSFETYRIDAKFVLHIYDIDRCGQLRGVPWLANNTIKLRDLDEYQDAQLVKQKISACMTGFITDPEGSTGLTEEEKEILEKFEPGTINILGPGQDYKQSEPPKIEGYKDHVNMELHAIAAGLGISYEALTGDLSMTNFSSAKLGRQSMDANVTSWREQLFYPGFLTPIIENWLVAASLTGVMVEGTDWKYTAPRREMIQPDKEIPATVDAVRAGLYSLREGIRQLGYDPDKVFAEIEQTNADLDKKGLVFTSDPRKNIVSKDTITTTTDDDSKSTDQE